MARSKIVERAAGLALVVGVALIGPAEVAAEVAGAPLRLPPKWTTGDELDGPPPPCTDCGPQNTRPRQPRKKLRFTETERAVLARGEIDRGARIAGPLVAASLGFGFGQAAQGRWRSAGWIFALGESGALLLSVLGISGGGCHSGNGHTCSTTAFLVPFLLVRGISVADTVLAPPMHNAELEKLRARQRKRKAPALHVAPFLVPAERGSGATGGVLLRF